MLWLWWVYTEEVVINQFPVVKLTQEDFPSSECYTKAQEKYNLRGWLTSSNKMDYIIVIISDLFFGVDDYLVQKLQKSNAIY